MKQRICFLLAALLLCATGLMIPAGASEINGETWNTAPSAASTEETRDPLPAAETTEETQDSLPAVGPAEETGVTLPSAEPVGENQDAPDESPWKMGLIDAGTYHSAWIREDGTVGTARNGQVPQHWKGITRIAASVGTVCLREDGTVVTAGSVQGKQSIATWRNIVDIDVSQSNTIGLTARGTVVVAGSNARKQCWEYDALIHIAFSILMMVRTSVSHLSAIS